MLRDKSILSKFEIDKKQRIIISSWHKLSRKSSFIDRSISNYYKFMCNWIAFNAICIAMFHDNANNETVFISNKKHLSDLKNRLKEEQLISVEKGDIKDTGLNIKVKLEFPEKLNFDIKIKYHENLIFEKFSKYFNNKIVFNYKSLQSLQMSLHKYDYRKSYVINMSKVKDYDKGSFNYQQMVEKQIIVPLEELNLPSIIRVLYQIRCNIFHGEKQVGTRNDDSIVRSAEPVLNTIVKCFTDVFNLNKFKDYRLTKIEKIILNKEKIPRSPFSFGGAGLIITSNSNNKYDNHNERYPFDVVVKTKFNKEISWLIFELQKISPPNYVHLGKIMKKSLSTKKNIYVVLNDILSAFNENYN